ASSSWLGINSSFSSLLNEAEKQGLPQVTPQLEVMPTVDKTVSPSIEAVPLDLTIEHFDHTPQSSLLQQLRQKLARGEIQLKCQEIYDKQDQETDTY
ncbi:diguanylate phosphodiesterase, partial [Acinetobacter baumannii]